MLSTSARPLSTTLGGTCCRPSALRSRLSTTTILVNEVTITATKGASASTITVISADEGVNWVRSICVDSSACGFDGQRPTVAPGHQPADGEGLRRPVAARAAPKAGLRPDV